MANRRLPLLLMPRRLGVEAAVPSCSLLKSSPCILANVGGWGGGEAKSPRGKPSVPRAVPQFSGQEPTGKNPINVQSLGTCVSYALSKRVGCFQQACSQITGNDYEPEGLQRAGDNLVPTEETDHSCNRADL